MISQPLSRVRRGVPVTTLLAAVAMVLVAACGSSSGSAASNGGSTGDGNSSGKTATTVAPKLFADNFTSVCQGASVSAATPYVKTAKTHKALYIETYTDALQDDSQQLPTDWTVQFSATGNAYAAVDVVGCGVRTSSKFIKTCTGYKDKQTDSGAGNTVKLYSGTYTVSVHEATTGKTLATTTMSSSDDTCPLIQSFDPGQKTANSYGAPSKDKVVAFLKPFVQPS